MDQQTSLPCSATLVFSPKGQRVDFRRAGQLQFGSPRRFPKRGALVLVDGGPWCIGPSPGSVSAWGRRLRTQHDKRYPISWHYRPRILPRFVRLPLNSFNGIVSRGSFAFCPFDWCWTVHSSASIPRRFWPPPALVSSSFFQFFLSFFVQAIGEEATVETSFFMNWIDRCVE